MEAKLLTRKDLVTAAQVSVIASAKLVAAIDAKGATPDFQTEVDAVNAANIDATSAVLALVNQIQMTGSYNTAFGGTLAETES